MGTEDGEMATGEVRRNNKGRKESSTPRGSWAGHVWPYDMAVIGCYDVTFGLNFHESALAC